jgi:hypothetical protein
MLCTFFNNIGESCIVIFLLSYEKLFSRSMAGNSFMNKYFLNEICVSQHSCKKTFLLFVSALFRAFIVPALRLVTFA